MPRLNTVNHVGGAIQSDLVAIGTNQATALQLVNDSFAQVITVPVGSGVILPVVNRLPSEIRIWNGGSNALLVYPPLGGNINDGAVNVPYSLSIGAAIYFFAADLRTWYGLTSSSGSPAPVPTFGAFGISGQATSIEVGATIAAGSKTFTWTTTNPTSINANSISITDTTASAVLASGLTNDGSEAITIDEIVHVLPATQVWTISGVSVASTTFSRASTISWLWRVYSGTSANVTLTEAQIEALSDSSALQAGFTGTYALSAGNYKYLCYPDSMGNPVNFRDPDTGMLASMATVADNAAYSHVGPNGWSYALVSVTNAQGVTTNYRVYRSQFPLGGAVNMLVS